MGVKIGVIGAGGHASTSLYPNFATAGLDVVAICARHQDRAAAAADRWGAPHFFDAAEKMLASVDLDAVVVSVPPSEYAPLVEACLKAGKPVFCEKPGAATAAEADTLAKLSAETGVPVVIGYMKRFAPAYQRAREIIHSADFGPPSLGAFTFAMGQGFDGDLRTYLIDNPGHHLDLARYLLGELSDLQAHVTELPGFGHAVAAIARASSGAVCTFNLCTTASWEQRNEYAEVYGKGHAVWIENVDTCTYRPPTGPEQVWRPNYTVPQVQNSSVTTMGFLPELTHFRQVVQGGAGTVSDIASAAQTLRLAERLCEIAGV
ncbi:MAG TPA: Gfo/Idh/MocA family oxidoreductase [Amycolatopsis sp.]|nr:Gfo/Idh/MocA family oxidoreductase [Amycolatopsis sp.]